MDSTSLTGTLHHGYNWGNIRCGMCLYHIPLNLQNDGNINKIPPKTQNPNTKETQMPKITHKPTSKKPSSNLSIFLRIVFIVLSIILLVSGLTTREREIADFFLIADK